MSFPLSANILNTFWSLLLVIRCGNVAAILELDEHLQREFIIFEAAPQETRGIPSKKPVADYFLWGPRADSHDVLKPPVPFHTRRAPSCCWTVLSVWTRSSSTENLPHPLELQTASAWRAGFLPYCPRLTEQSLWKVYGGGWYWAHDCCHFSSDINWSFSSRPPSISNFCPLTLCRYSTLPPSTYLVFFHDEHCHLVLEVFGRS